MMPALEDHHASRVTKVLVMGDPGSGKTGALAALADAGYNLRIIDLDNGLDVLKNVLMDPKSPYDREAYKRVKYVTITETPSKISARGGSETPKSAVVWNRLTAILTNWKTPSEDLGSMTTWTERDVLVIDSLTLAGIAAYNFSAISNSGPKTDGRMIYFHAQNYLEYLMQCLYAEDVKCNVIVNAHITFVGDEVNIAHGYPITIGSRLSPKIGRYFNSMLMMKTDGKNHRLYTVPTGSKVELKSSAPLRVKDSYDIKFGLAEYFKDVQGEVEAETPRIRAV
jgi:hypothetical protein